MGTDGRGKIEKDLDDDELARIQQWVNAAYTIPLAPSTAARMMAEIKRRRVESELFRALMDASGPDVIPSGSDVVIKLKLSEVRALLQCSMTGTEEARSIAGSVMDRLRFVVDALPKEAQ